MKKIRITDDVDRLPQLPEEILERIFYLLPSAEAAVRMSLVSKTWPQFPYRFDLIIDKNPPADSVTSEDDKTLSILTQHKDDDPKRKIGAFQITRIFSGREERAEAHDHLVDQWIKLVTKHYLLSLDISFSDFQYYSTSRYRFPCSPIDLVSFQRLCLSVCVLDKALVQNETKLNCLKSLDLCHVELNGIFWELLFKCPSLENLGVKYCCDQGDYEYLPFDSRNCSKGNKITALKGVRTLRFASSSPEVLDVKVLKNWKLEVLHIDTPYSAISGIYMNDYRLVEVENRLRISTILDSFESSTQIPNNCQQDCMKLKVLKLNLRMRPSISSSLKYPANSLNSEWLLALRNYLGKFPQLERFTLELDTNPTKVSLK
ncbi:hypothetical protein ACLB2K_039308 [Fragaria x ananassa]